MPTKRLLMSVSCAALAAIALSLSGCGDSDSDPLDENGAHDMREADVLLMLTAINESCAANGDLAGIGADTEESCRAACDCSVSAVAGLEARESAPELTDACYHACSPDFTATRDVPVAEVDEDDEPEYDKFFLAYIVKCDEVAQRVTTTEGDFVEECVDTCNCIADTMEKYISETEDDNLRSGCEAQCTASAPRSLSSVGSANMSLFVRGAH